MYSKLLSMVWLPCLIVCVIGSPGVHAEQAFLQNKDLSGQKEVVNAANAWNITDTGLTRLRSYLLRGEIDIYMPTKVRVLHLDGTPITDAGLKHLEGLDGLLDLEEISLENTRITDAGLASLAKLKQLQRVNLGRSYVTKAGVSGVRVTSSGLKELRTALPRCRITYEEISLELSEAQQQQFQLWSRVAEVRLNYQGEIIGLMIHSNAQLTEAHRKSLSSLNQLAELHAGGVFQSEDLSSLAALTNLRKLCLRDCAVNDTHLAPLANLQSLTVLDLAGTPLTDTGLRHLQPLHKLAAIDLRETSVRTSGLQSLRNSLPETNIVIDPWRVVQLPYQWVKVNDRFELASVGNIGYRQSRKQVLTTLGQLLKHPSLEQLGLRHCKSLRDDDIELVAKMVNMRELDLGNTRISATGISHLTNLKRLKKLNLWMTEIDRDGGLSALETLPNLESLELDETDIDDTALPVLSRMKSLRYLELWHTNVTRAGVARLQQQRPELVIKANPRR